MIHILAKSPGASVFDLSHESNMARMLRDGSKAVRRGGLDEAKTNPEEYILREQSDFLTKVNHEGEVIAFIPGGIPAGHIWR